MSRGLLYGQKRTKRQSHAVSRSEGKLYFGYQISSSQGLRKKVFGPGLVNPGHGFWSERSSVNGSMALIHLFCGAMEIPGPGKTVLASIVQDLVSKRFEQDPKITSGFVYCSYRDLRDPAAFVFSFLRQMLVQLPNLPPGVEDQFDLLYPKGKKLLTKHINLPVDDHEKSSEFDLFSYVLETFRKVHLLFDGLDECNDRSQWLVPFLCKLVRRYRNRPHSTILKLFIPVADRLISLMPSETCLQYLSKHQMFLATLKLLFIPSFETALRKDG